MELCIFIHWSLPVLICLLVWPKECFQHLIHLGLNLILLGSELKVFSLHEKCNLTSPAQGVYSRCWLHLIMIFHLIHVFGLFIYSSECILLWWNQNDSSCIICYYICVCGVCTCRTSFWSRIIQYFAYRGTLVYYLLGYPCFTNYK